MECIRAATSLRSCLVLAASQFGVGDSCCLAGLSAREQNQLKRKMKQAGKGAVKQAKKAKTEPLTPSERAVSQVPQTMPIFFAIFKEVSAALSILCVVPF